MNILKFPAKELFMVCETIPEITPDLIQLLDGMFEAMTRANGIGLSANQVGRPIRAFVMRGPDGERINVINPIIMEKSESSANLKEGCLSAPGDFVTLKERPSWVKLSFMDEKGEEHARVFRGIHAVCVCHEIDHLDGKSHLQSPSLTRAEKRAFAKKWGF